MSFGGWSQAATPSMRVPMKISTGQLVEGYVATSATTLDTTWVPPKGAQRVGAFINLAAEDSASSTVDVDFEQSPDKGTTFTEMPDGINSETGAVLAQFTAVGSKYKWFEHCGDAQFTVIRAEITVAGSTASDTITFGPSYWIFANVD